MSRKTKRNLAALKREVPEAEQAPKGGAIGGRSLVIGAVVALLLAVVATVVLYNREETPSSQLMDGPGPAALASVHSPTLGNEDAKVHVVEFLDPACETCAQFYPLVKQILAENPNRLRLSVRHVAFHEGSDYAVRVLEASRRQDKYWQTLEALLSSQALWAPRHTVRPDLIGDAIAGVGLDVEQLKVDMYAPEVTQRIERDLSDAKALKVTATPEYFVNGRPMPSFGEQQLLDLVSEELQRAY
jgi:protein-disulfide isomerase